MQIHQIMRRCTRAAAEIVFVFSGFNERTSFIFAKDRHFFEEQCFESQIVHAQRPCRRLGHGRFKYPTATDLEKEKEHMQIYWLDQQPHTGQFRRK